jgi:hypothetical protein
MSNTAFFMPETHFSMKILGENGDAKLGKSVKFSVFLIKTSINLSYLLIKYDNFSLSF